MADNESNTTDTEVSALQDKYGFNLLYDPQSETFFLKRDGHNGDTEIIDRRAWNDQHLQDMIKIFSANATDGQGNSPQDIQLSLAQALQIKDPLPPLYEERDLLQTLQEKNPDLSLAYYSGDNNITFIKYNVKPEERAECIKLLQAKKGLSEEKAIKAVDLFTDLDISDLNAREAHEEGHLKDHLKSGNRQYDIHPEYMARLNGLSEIKSAMIEAGKALKEYETTGNLNAFDYLGTRFADDIKNTFKENPNMENKAEFVAGYINDKWLEIYNQPGTTYSEQMYQNSTPKDNNYPMWAIDKSPAVHQEYLDRVESMFEEDIPGLGNVRKFINPDFTLNDELTQKLKVDCMQVLGNDNLYRLSQKGKLNDYFEQVKDVYADGIVTKEEAKQLDNFVEIETHTTPYRYKTNGQSTLSDEDLNRILEKSGRGGSPQPTSPTEKREPLEIQPAPMTMTMPSPSTNSQQAYNPLAGNPSPTPADNPSPTLAPEVPLQSQVSTLEPPHQAFNDDVPPAGKEQSNSSNLTFASLSSAEKGYVLNNFYRVGKGWNDYCSKSDSQIKVPYRPDNQISSPQITMAGNIGNTGR